MARALLRLQVAVVDCLGQEVCSFGGWPHSRLLRTHSTTHGNKWCRNGIIDTSRAKVVDITVEADVFSPFFHARCCQHIRSVNDVSVSAEVVGQPTDPGIPLSQHGRTEGE